MDRLTALRAYVRVVELGTMTGAAAELRVKQSTVSKWVAALEAEVGVPLIERTTRTHRLTDAGRTFHQRARAILAAWEEATAELQADGAGLRGRVRLSVPVVFGRLHVVPALPDFLRAHPGIALELRFSDRYVNLIDEDLDVAIRVGLSVDSSFRERRLTETGRQLVASPAYVTAHGAPAAPAELEGRDCLLHSALGAGDVWTLTDDDGTPHRARVTGRFSADNSDALRWMAVEGLGIALLADWLVAEDLAAGRLVPLLTDYALPPAPIRAVMPPTTFVNPRVRALLDHLGEALRVRLA